MRKITKIIVLLLLSAFGLELIAQQKERIVEISTDFGKMKVKLYNETPLHRDNFIKLVKEGTLDGTLFHRVIKDFMIQGGDPTSKNSAPDAALGNGGPGYTIPAEFNDRFFHKKGALSAARQSDQVNPKKESSGSQFYIVQGRTYTVNDLASFEQRQNAGKNQEAGREFFNKPENKAYQERLMKLQNEKNDQGLRDLFAEVQPLIEVEAQKRGLFKYTPEQIAAYSSIGGTPHLDGAYTVFGEVIEGLEIIDTIAKVETGRADRPVKDVIMRVKIIE